MEQEAEGSIVEGRTERCLSDERDDESAQLLPTAEQVAESSSSGHLLPSTSFVAAARPIAKGHKLAADWIVVLDP